VDGQPVVNRWKEIAEVPAKTALSETLSRDMKSRGFSFLGPIACYAFLQSAGLVNDHLVSCFRHRPVQLL
jgi:DNA-3-methyladenine glycosylase I